MEFLIKTESGAQYHVSFTEKTWEREAGLSPAFVRGTGPQKFKQVGPIIKGEPLKLFMEPHSTSEPGTQFRLVSTSPIVSVERLSAKQFDGEARFIYWESEQIEGRPEYQKPADGLWYFWTETWADHEGPYPDFETCTRKIKEYGNWLTGGDETFYKSPNGELALPDTTLLSVKVAQAPKA